MSTKGDPDLVAVLGPEGAYMGTTYHALCFTHHLSATALKLPETPLAFSDRMWLNPPSNRSRPMLAGSIRLDGQCLLAALLLLAGPLEAQRPDSIQQVRQEVLSHAHVVRWYEATAVVGGVGALMLLDEPVQRYAQDWPPG
jgi:hypothetical protein